MKKATFALLAVTLSFSLAHSQQFVYPAKGQAPDQQKSDEASCYSWAVQQTGFDPAYPSARQPTTVRHR